MKKALSEKGRLHLFDDVRVRRGVGRSGTGDILSLCGSFAHSGPFTELRDDPDDLDGLCGNCANVVAGDEDDGDDE